MYSIQTVEIKKGSNNYPKSLLDLEDPPESIFVRGILDTLFEPRLLSVVGSRKVSQYGRSVAKALVPSIAKQGIVIVSGFMYGVDTLAHGAALSVPGGKTIAVFAQGLNHIYPQENASLYEEIVQHGGCVVSEYPMDFAPQKWTFPKRNRIVAALGTMGTLVIEASEQSGSLITAQYADALNRPLFAIPGPISSETSKGTNLLIKGGLAKMVTQVEDILDSQ